MTKIIQLRETSPDGEAASWIARMDAGPLSAEERSRLKDWLDADPAHARMLDDHARVWAAADVIRRRRPVERHRVSRRMAMGGGLAAVAAATIGGAVLMSPSAGFAATYSTPVGGSRTVDLPDGSRLLINTDSELRVSFSDKRRSVVLVRGEAFFTVAHDKARPFEVSAASTITRAVGTRFSVRLESPEKISVVVTEGLVHVRGRPGPGKEDLTPLRAGQAATIGPANIGIAPLDTAQIERATGWTRGGVAFRNERLGDVIAEVNRYTPHRIRLAEASLSDLKVSGYLATDNVAGFVSGLSAAAGLDTATTPQGDVVISRVE